MLRGSLETFDKRLSALEHLVNDVIIDGLKNAADSYADDEAYSAFVDTYKPDFESLEAPLKVVYGEDYDIGSDLYEQMKGVDRTVEGFDEKATVLEKIKELQDKLEQLKASMETKEDVGAPSDEGPKSTEEGEDEEIDIDELKRIYKE